jgi:hypothetical protein
MTPAERSRRYRARKAGQPVPKMRPGRKPSAETPRALKQRAERAERKVRELQNLLHNSRGGPHWLQKVELDNKALLDEIARKDQRIEELEWLVRTGFHHKDH